MAAKASLGTKHLDRGGALAVDPRWRLVRRRGRRRRGVICGMPGILRDSAAVSSL